MRLAWRRGRVANIDGLNQLSFLGRPDFLCCPQCAPHDRVFRFLRDRNELVAVGAVGLCSVTHAFGFLSKYPLATVTPNLNLVVYDHKEALSSKGASLALGRYERLKAMFAMGST